LGHQTKTHVNYILYKDINNKSKQNYPNYQMQMMLLKPVLCFMQQQQEVVESQQIQPNGEQLSIVTGEECVGQAQGRREVGGGPGQIFFRGPWAICRS
jgi:hypothetical protein